MQAILDSMQVDEEALQVMTSAAERAQVARGKPSSTQSPQQKIESYELSLLP